MPKAARHPTVLMGMTTQQYRAIELGIIPRAPRAVSNADILSAAASLEFCPAKGAARRARFDHIATLIAEELYDFGIER